jgi:hypothetical protein
VFDALSNKLDRYASSKHFQPYLKFVCKALEAHAEPTRVEQLMVTSEAHTEPTQAEQHTVTRSKSRYHVLL